MHLDVHDLREFYYRSALGRAAQKAIRDRLTTLWPEAKGQTVVGFGFAVPLLRPYLGAARRVTALMPGPQGVMAWPAGMPNVSVLCEETRWPVETGRVDKLVVMHGLETSEEPAALLSEIHRVLGPGGRALFIVPNRAGLWSSRDETPFGFGRPYSLGQLETQLRDHAFITESAGAALYQPPSSRRFWRRTAPMWERFGRNLPAMLAGGVLLVEVSKQAQAGVMRPRQPSRSRNILEGLTAPEAHPVAGREESPLAARGGLAARGHS
ncbi:class I SAM-dependent methyltransferase [Poseidonocella sedimentorum]|uniref:Methyltransferase domain-containing protein n=1 Tax=Poseidonocella sedimentorum TaxID=871652 RepID=A0A1I6DY77_9RHOB|nr:methyltransferase domain-containing protein [Poseidonocella sedimentorum]SFR10281.1 Methyltransferase domain-containing protein [Poseidonocella sedimentorum]